ncbi:MAG: phenylalanine--tRNA ligase subunit beta [Bacteroidetes bacterium HGW-Bacteroidetes-17]|jgi:phenylalanyl-tRNA synthetase beta chain|nr:MAG: phenylalanine--tRNA ligase subunit beta [Bacteroidetes bacterium HGW-Bacteroidetes-17]
MKISYNWLKRYVDFDLAPEELSVLLTDCGLEVESFEKIESVKGGLKGVVIGEVKSRIQHPNADKLSCTTVDIGGEELLSIVCGAPNVAAGQKVPVATVGTMIYMGNESFEIKKSKIRGEISEGMICAEDELGLGTEHAGIMVLDPSAKIGSPAKDYFGVEGDYVFEIGLTPNRADATSHIGVARDLVAVLNNIYPDHNYKLKIPSVADFKVDSETRKIEIVVEDAKACPRYTGITVSGLKVKPSPAWMQNLLKTLGLKPINNVVDITNFILFETGQPLHAFNAEAIDGNKVIVKKLKEGTKFITLDEQERSLNQNDLMICNSTEGMCMAGVYGGLGSGITATTSNLFLESAYFDPATIRKTSKFHGLQTDASFRFERGADPNMTEYALKRACLLFKELAAGLITSNIVDVYPSPIQKWSVEIEYTNVDRLIGKCIDRSVIKRILVNLGIEIIDETELGLNLLIPTYKVDVTREADVIEEILRIYGYNNIEYSENLNSSLSYSDEQDRKELLQNQISAFLSDNGFFEIMNNSLINSKYFEKQEVYKAEENVKVLNPVSSDLDVLRQSLLFGGLESIEYNQNRKNPDIKFYEFGQIYSKSNAEINLANALDKFHESKHLAVFLSGKIAPENWQQESRQVDFYSLKFFVHQILKRLDVNLSNIQVNEDVDALFEYGQTIHLNNKEMVNFGSLSKKILKQFDIKQKVFYADFSWDQLSKAVRKSKTQFSEIPKFQEVRRDLALMLNKEVTFESIKDLAFKTERKLLKSVLLFDIYEGDKIEKGKKSYALSFILRDEYQTLTDKVVDKVMNKLMLTFEQQLNASIRK